MCGASSSTVKVKNRVLNSSAPLPLWTWRHHSQLGQIRSGVYLQICRLYPARIVEIRVANDIPARRIPNANDLDILLRVNVADQRVCVGGSCPTACKLSYSWALGRLTAGRLRQGRLCKTGRGRNGRRQRRSGICANGLSQHHHCQLRCNRANRIYWRRCGFGRTGSPNKSECNANQRSAYHFNIHQKVTCPSFPSSPRHPSN